MKKARIIIDAAIAVAIGFALTGSRGPVGASVSADVASGIVGGACGGPDTGTTSCAGPRCKGTALKGLAEGNTRAPTGSSNYCATGVTGACLSAATGNPFGCSL